MTLPVNWFDQLDDRIARAKALGWEASLVAPPSSMWPNGFWIMNDPAPSQFSGLGASEREAFTDVLADADLWDEITQLLNEVRS